MSSILVMNNVSQSGLSQLPSDRYQISDSVEQPDAIILRSAKLHDYDFPTSVKVVGRAGAGVNNIPVDKLTSMGVPVLNTPGANANAVKELVLTGMLLASRNICQAWQYVNELQGDDETLGQLVEKGKKQYVGYELPGRTLAVIGLGAIGVKVANAAAALGMRVLGFDPKITVRNAWELSSSVQQAHSVAEMLPQADFISVHVPLNEFTKGLIGTEAFGQMKNGAILMNFARDGIVDNDALLKALDDKCGGYVCDFPVNKLKGHAKVIALPHLGASTFEAEENCAVMVVNQVQQFLEDGTIHHSVNFPEVQMPRDVQDSVRLAIANRNVPNMVAQISAVLAKQNFNIVDLINKSRGDIAYTLIDVEQSVDAQTMAALTAIDGVINVRVCQ